MEEKGGFLSDSDTEEKTTQKIGEEQSISLPRYKNDCCMYCKIIPVVYEIKKEFGILICSSCSRSKLKFITKSTAKNSYLLTEEEISEYRFLTRPNPHKGSWNDMHLYLENQIVEFALKKHGSISNIQNMIDQRKEKIKSKKIKKIKNKINELKKKTFLKTKKDRHVHKFVYVNEKSVCECGMTIEEEIL